MNRHTDKPACYREWVGSHKIYKKCRAHGSPPDLEQMKNLTPGCKGCHRLKQWENEDNENQI